MGLFKGNLDSANMFTAQDNIQGLKIRAPGSIPASIAYETVDGVIWYYFHDDDDNLKRHTSAPTSAYASEGSTVYGASNAGASTNLSNLATTTAISESLLSDTDDTDDLGSATKQWAKGYIKILYLSSTSILTGGTNVSVLTGGLTLGADGTDTDLICYGETTGQFMIWDGNAYTNDGALILKDNVMLAFGMPTATTGDITMEWNGTTFEIDSAADNSVINIGTTYQPDVVFHGNTATSDAGWDASADTWQICDDSTLSIGGTGVGTHDGVTFKFVAADSALDIDARTANDAMIFGSNTVTDLQIHGASYDVYWDGSEDAWIFRDLAECTFGTSMDIYMRYEGTGNTLDIGQTVADTGSIDFIDIGAVFTGADGRGTLLQVIGIDTTSNSDSVIIDHSGSGNALYIDQNEADSQGITVEPYASSTVAAIEIDGDAAGWTGASGVGMLHLRNDIQLAHANASLLLVDNAANTTTQISALGYCLRVADSGAVTSDASAAYATYVTSTANNAMGLTTVAKAKTSLVAIPAASATASVITVDGDTNGWVGATNVGMVHIQNDVQLAHANASLLLVDNAANTTAQQSALGYCFKVVDAGAVTSDASVAYATYVNSTANNAMYLGTTGTGKTALTVAGAAGTTVPVLKVDGDTAGWYGANNQGMIHVDNDVQTTGQSATLVYLDNAGAATPSQQGICIRMADTGTAATAGSGYVAHLSSTNNEAMWVDSGKVLVDEEVEVGSLQFTNTAVAATVDGSTTGTITDTTSFATVTATDADAIVILPTPTIGKVVWLSNVTDGYELRTDTPASVSINGGSGDSAECAIAATDELTRCVCQTATTWIVTHFASDGTESKGDAAAA